MKEAKFTKEPYRLHCDAAGWYISPVEVELPNTPMNGDGRSKEELEATAVLLTAAPDLYAVAKEWLDYFDDLMRQYEPGDPLADLQRNFHGPRIERTRAALAKAVQR